MLKSRTGRAIRAIGDVMDGIFNDDEIRPHAGAFHGGTLLFFAFLTLTYLFQQRKSVDNIDLSITVHIRTL